ncbi:MAG: hydrogen gas-evolving membrane-bound hydrogenase subunit E [Bacillota bacterium]
MKKTFIKVLFLGLFVLLSYNIIQMPGHQTKDAPAYNDTANHYLDESVEETGAINVVAAVLADYRAFDTLGETIVLFISTVAVASILKVADNKYGKKAGDTSE